LASIQRRCARKSFTEINDLKATAQTFGIDAIKDDRYFCHVLKIMFPQGAPMRASALAAGFAVILRLHWWLRRLTGEIGTGVMLRWLAKPPDLSAASPPRQ